MQRKAWEQIVSSLTQMCTSSSKNQGYESFLKLKVRENSVHLRTAKQTTSSGYYCCAPHNINVPGEEKRSWSSSMQPQPQGIRKSDRSQLLHLVFAWCHEQQIWWCFLYLLFFAALLGSLRRCCYAQGSMGNWSKLPKRILLSISVWCFENTNWWCFVIHNLSSIWLFMDHLCLRSIYHLLFTIYSLPGLPCV